MKKEETEKILNFLEKHFSKGFLVGMDYNKKYYRLMVNDKNPISDAEFTFLLVNFEKFLDDLKRIFWSNIEKRITERKSDYIG